MSDLDPNPPGSPEALAPLPRFRASSPPLSPPETPEPEVPLTDPPPRAARRSSPASTEPPRPESIAATPEERAETKKLLTEAADMAFTLLAGLAQWIHRRRTGSAERDSRWTPQPAERRQVARPAARIISRRLPASELPIQDAADMAMVGLGVGRYVTRAALDLDPMDPITEEESDQ